MNDTSKTNASDDLATAALNDAQMSEATALVDNEVAASDQVAQTLQSLQNVIERNARELSRIEDELKQKRESLKSLFENNSDLAEAEQVLEVQSQAVKEKRAKVQSDPQATTLKVQIGELSQQKKETEETLSDHLVNYHSLTHSKSFDTSDGDQWEFDIRAKVKGNKKHSS